MDHKEIADENSILKLRLTAFERLSSFISSDFDLAKALNYTLDLILELFGAESGSIMLLDNSRLYLDFNVARGPKSDAIKQIKIRVGEGIAGKVAQTGESILVSNASSNAIFDKKIGTQIGYIPQNILCVPLKVKDKNYGVVEIMDKNDGTPFTEDEKRLLLSISSTMAILIENIRLFNITADDVIKLSTLMKVSKIINTTMEIDKLLEYIMSAAKDVLKAEASSLLLLDEEKNELFFNVATGEKGAQIKQIRVPVGRGIAGIVAQNGEPLLIADAQNDSRVFKQADEKTKFVTKNMIAVPMRAKDKIIGVLEVINAIDKQTYDEYDLNLCQSLADHAGIAINNRDLFQHLKDANIELQQRVKETQALYDISQTVASGTSINLIFNSIIKIIADTMQINKCSLFLFDKESSKLKIKSAVGINERLFDKIALETETGISGHVYSTGDSLLINDIEKEKRFGRYKRLRYRTKSFCTVPIKQRDKTIGILNVADKKNYADFDANDLRLIMTISGQIGESYDNYILNQEFLEKQRIEKELEVTYNIQQSVLPKEFPGIKNLDVAAVSVPAKEVGGDFYDYMLLDENKFAFLIADVSGKSIPASLFMAFSRSTIRIEALTHHSPQKVMEISNQFILDDSKGGMFVTVFYISCDTSNKILEFASAGHNEQLYFHSKENRFEYLKAKGKPLGVIENSRYEEKKIPYKKDDILVLFTDGVTEAVNKNNEEFGLENLERIIKQYKNLPVTELLNRITKNVTSFCGEMAQFDDITLMVIKFK